MNSTTFGTTEYLTESEVAQGLAQASHEIEFGKPLAPEGILALADEVRKGWMVPLGHTPEVVDNSLIPNRIAYVNQEFSEEERNGYAVGLTMGFAITNSSLTTALRTMIEDATTPAALLYYTTILSAAGAVVRERFMKALDAITTEDLGDLVAPMLMNDMLTAMPEGVPCGAECDCE